MPSCSGSGDMARCLRPRIWFDDAGSDCPSSCGRGLVTVVVTSGCRKSPILLLLGFGAEIVVLGGSEGESGLIGSSDVDRDGDVEDRESARTPEFCELAARRKTPLNLVSAHLEAARAVWLESC